MEAARLDESFNCRMRRYNHFSFLKNGHRLVIDFIEENTAANFKLLICIRILLILLPENPECFNKSELKDAIMGNNVKWRKVY